MTSQTHKPPRKIQENSQSGLILARLRATPGEWVPMPELARIAGCYVVHSRIAEIRTALIPEGLTVENDSGKRDGSKVKSFYRLIPFQCSLWDREVA